MHLAEGEVDRGMSGGLWWEPFDITGDEYQEVATELGLEIVDKPSSADSEVDWYLWCFHESYGVPIDKHRILYESMIKLDQACESAYENNNPELAEVLHLKYVEASNQLHDFLGEFI